MHGKNVETTFFGCIFLDAHAVQTIHTKTCLDAALIYLDR